MIIIFICHVQYDIGGTKMINNLKYFMGMETNSKVTRQVLVFVVLSGWTGHWLVASLYQSCCPGWGIEMFKSEMNKHFEGSCELLSLTFILMQTSC